MFDCENVQVFLLKMLRDEQSKVTFKYHELLRLLYIICQHIRHIEFRREKTNNKKERGEQKSHTKRCFWRSFR